MPTVLVEAVRLRVSECVMDETKGGSGLQGMEGKKGRAERKRGFVS